MGLSPGDMDASKWRSEYAAACDGHKISMQKQPEPTASLKKRRSLIGKSQGKSVAFKEAKGEDIEVEVDGFVMVNRPKVQQTKRPSMKKSTGNDSDIFPKTTSTFQFVSEHESCFTWPEKSVEIVPSSTPEKMSNGKKLLRMLGAPSPPYALDDDAILPSKGRTKSYSLSLEKPLNLFDDSDLPMSTVSPAIVVRCIIIILLLTIFLHNLPYYAH